MTTSNPYRESAAMETPAERVERCRQIYWAMAAVNIAGKSPDEREQIERGFQRASRAYQRALDALKASGNGE
jgi:hypothetical protein